MWKAGTIGKFTVFVTVPITVFGVGDETPWELQPVSIRAPNTRAATMTAERRTGTGL